MIRRIVIVAGLWAISGALGLSAQAQSLGVGQPLVDKRFVAGIPAAAKPGEKPGLPAQPAPSDDLMLRDYDPDAPLPHPDLAEMASPELRWQGPRPYVHIQSEERGGGLLGLNGVLGLTVPFPTNRATDR